MIPALSQFRYRALAHTSTPADSTPFSKFIQEFCRMKEEKYPNHLDIYRDRSKKEINSEEWSCAAAYVIPSLDFYYSFRLNPATSILGAELFSICEALKLHAKETAIFTDSLTAISMMNNKDTIRFKTLVHNMQEMLIEMNSNYNFVKLQWIPSHKGIMGNELADATTKQGLNNPCTLNREENNIKEKKMIETLQMEWMFSNQVSCSVHLKLLLKIGKRLIVEIEK
ncbi:uncharacterized protein [Palaemon carinicauda]|uniref:uncharacterized protein n=1 Tax=Palaemon carinicauda TaxID=392227 RepID=UPI0035B6A9F4